MLEEHRAEVQDLLLTKKNEFEAARRAEEEEDDMTDDTGEPDEAAMSKAQARHGSKLKSPPENRASSAQGSRAGSVHGNGNGSGNGGGNGNGAARSRLPQLGFFSPSESS